MSTAPTYYENFKKGLVYSNVWVAIAMAALTQLMTCLSDSPHYGIAAANFLLTFAGYNYLYLSVFFTMPSKIGSARRKWLEVHKLLLITASALSAITAYTLLYIYSPDDKLRIAFISVLAILYTIPYKKNTGLRWIPAAKIFIIATVWAALATLPFQFESVNSFTPFIAVWLFMIGLTIPFDVRDAQNDPSSLKTIPQLLGSDKAAINLAIVCIFLALGILTIYFFSLKLLITNSIFMAISTRALLGINKHTSNSYISFQIEGLPLIWLMIYYTILLI
ncbi:hypothetical protein [Carboxylicivirga taeanensis]|uniref:hypothetical protein n=1 Tax=Carboxylicivirga taeanensis TaxID=1416875 RepID=UPI003F6E3D10